MKVIMGVFLQNTFNVASNDDVIMMSQKERRNLRNLGTYQTDSSILKSKPHHHHILSFSHLSPTLSLSLSPSLSFRARAFESSNNHNGCTMMYCNKGVKYNIIHWVSIVSTEGVLETLEVEYAQREDMTPTWC